MRRAWNAFVDFYWGEGIADDVPALVYYLILSLAPFVLGVTAVAAVVLQNEVTQEQIADEIARYTPELIQDSLTRLVVSAQQESPLLFVLAVGAMLWTSSGAIGIIERCLSRMLERRRHPIVIGRIRNIAVGALFALLIILGAAAGSATSDVLRELGLQGKDVQPLVLVGNTVGSIVLFSLVLHWTPLGRLHWRSSFAGGVLAGVLLQTLPPLIRFYVDLFAGVAAERIFFLLASILFTFYLLALIVMISTGVAALVERRIEAALTRPRVTMAERVTRIARRHVANRPRSRAQDDEDVSRAAGPDPELTTKHMHRPE
jgi:uncharacterized BrkB/YihY/UPF0761 family membrane protein